MFLVIKTHLSVTKMVVALVTKMLPKWSLFWSSKRLLFRSRKLLNKTLFLLIKTHLSVTNSSVHCLPAVSFLCDSDFMYGLTLVSIRQSTMWMGPLG